MGDLHGLMVSICSLSKHGAQSTPIHNLINPRLNNLVLGMSAISFHHLSNNDAMTPTVKPILLYPDNSKAIKDDITWLLATYCCHRSTCTQTPVSALPPVTGYGNIHFLRDTLLRDHTQP